MTEPGKMGTGSQVPVEVSGGYVGPEEQENYLRMAIEKEGRNLRKLVVNVCPDGEHVILEYHCRPEAFQRVRRVR